MIDAATTFGGAVVAGAVGGLHCAAMCGPLVGWASGAGRAVNKFGGRGSLKVSATYQAGRLLTYTALGGVAAVVGESFASSDALSSARWVAAVAAAGALLIAGVAHLLPRRVGAFGRMSGKAAAALTRVGAQVGGHGGAALVGMASGLLPCGMLWAFVLAAAATGSAIGAVSVMVGLWLGSLPWLTASVLAASAAGGWLGKHGRRAIGVALILLAAMTLVQRWPSSEEQPAHACPHHAAAADPEAGSH